jgi:hypothetical protein
MDEIRQTYFDEAKAVAEAKWARFQLKMQLKSSGSPPISLDTQEKKAKKKRTIKMDPNWKCEGNLLTGEPCANSEAGPNNKRVNFEGKFRLLCTDCTAAFHNVKNLNKKVKKAATEPKEPEEQQQQQEEEEEEEIN